MKVLKEFTRSVNRALFLVLTVNTGSPIGIEATPDKSNPVHLRSQKHLVVQVSSQLVGFEVQIILMNS